MKNTANSTVNEFQVTQRRSQTHNQENSLLGFGMMRLPEKDGKIDRETALKMVDRAFACGVNYFDTAYPYHEGESEVFAGIALKRYPRECFYLASKMPTFIMKNEQDNERFFKQQLERTRLEYFDYYLMHWLNDEHWEVAKKCKTLDFMKKMQAEGKIRKIGFSFHGNPEKLKEIADAWPWDLAQIQLNYLDWTDCRSGEQYQILTERGIPVAIMEPLKGGSLVHLCEEAQTIFQKANPKASTASWGLRYAASLPNVQVVLSGMSTPEQLEDNLKTFMPFTPLSHDERNTIDEALAAYRTSKPIPCSSCHYCAPCPKNVDIPSTLAIANQFKALAGQVFKNNAKVSYDTIPEENRATSCVGCGLCITRCPQKIDIPAHFQELLRELEDWDRVFPTLMNPKEHDA